MNDSGRQPTIVEIVTIWAMQTVFFILCAALVSPNNPSLINLVILVAISALVLLVALKNYLWKGGK